MLELRLLGQFDVRRDGLPIDIPSRPAQSLLAYLALSPGTAHRREKLSGLLWPDASEANARSNLRHALWRIRQAISPRPDRAPECLQADNISITLQPVGGVWIDTEVLDRPAQPGAPLDDLIESVAAYGGELLPGFYDDWVVLERERLRATVERKMQLLLDGLLAAERWEEAGEWSQRWLAFGQAPEPAFRALMRARHGLGDLAGMAAVYRRCSETLEKELGVEPSEQTRSLYSRLAGRQKPAPAGEAAVQAAGPAGSESPLRSLFENWQRSKVQFLDLASLALVHAAQDGESLGRDEARLVIRSAIHHDIDLDPWIGRTVLPEFAASILQESLQEYPRPPIRLKIIRALEEIRGPEAEATLLHAVQTDDAASVKAAAALAAAKRGNLDRVVDSLLESIRSNGDPSAMAALVVVADEVGLPAGIGPLPRLPLWLALGQRRWLAHRPAVLQQTWRAALGGAAGLVAASLLQLIPASLLVPEVIQENLTFVSLPLWLLSLALVGLLWGGLFGAAIGFMASLADAVWPAPTRRRMRMLFGALAGIVHAAFYILLTLSGGFRTSVSAAVFIPAYLLFGLLAGGALSWVVPELDGRIAGGFRGRQVAAAIAALALLAVPTDFVIVGSGFQTAMIVDLLTAFCLPLGLGLAFRRKPDLLT